MNTENERHDVQPEVLDLGAVSVETRGSGFGAEPTGIGRLVLDGIAEE